MGSFKKFKKFDKVKLQVRPINQLNDIVELKTENDIVKLNKHEVVELINYLVRISI